MEQPEQNLEKGSTFLEEDEDVALENIEYSGLSAYVHGRYTRAKDQRLQDEQRLVKSYRN